MRRHFTIIMRFVAASAGILAMGCEATPRDATSRDQPPGGGQWATATDSLLAGTPVIVDDTLWRLPSGATVPSRLRAAIEYIGRIDGEGGPYLLASGVECNYCDASLSVLLQQAADSIGYLGREVPGWYVYPGAVRGTGTDSVVLATRLFWGQCLADRGPGLVQFATENDSVGAFERRVVRVTGVRDRRLVDDSIMVSPPDTMDVRRAVEAGTCREVPPREQVAGF